MTQPTQSHSQLRPNLRSPNLNLQSYPTSLKFSKIYANNQVLIQWEFSFSSLLFHSECFYPIYLFSLGFFLIFSLLLATFQAKMKYFPYFLEILKFSDFLSQNEKIAQIFATFLELGVNKKKNFQLFFYCVLDEIKKFWVQNRFKQ